VAVVVEHAGVDVVRRGGGSTIIAGSAAATSRTRPLAGSVEPDSRPRGAAVRPLRRRCTVSTGIGYVRPRIHTTAWMPA
ncbi:MAG TPA: hypothetical protein VFV80_13105, partial [Geminicoccaceae bacterium]|nr:hypothetical protein [Geminicoccaceae bacterium]